MSHIYDLPPSDSARKNSGGGNKPRRGNKPAVLDGLNHYASMTWSRRYYLDEMLNLVSAGGILTPSQEKETVSALAHWERSFNEGPLDLDAVPPFHDPDVWALAIIWRDKAVASGRDDAYSARFIYSLLVNRIELSHIRSNYRLVPAHKAGDRNIPARPGWGDTDAGPGWQRCISAMITYYWKNYSRRAGTGTDLLRDFCDRKEFEALRDTVTRQAINKALGDPREWPKSRPRPVSPEERKRNQQRGRRK